MDISYSDYFLVTKRNLIFNSDIISYIDSIITLSDDNLMNRKLYNKKNLFLILEKVNISYKKIIIQIINEKSFNSIVNNIGLNIGCYTMFLTSISLLLEYLKKLTYLKNDIELFELFTIFCKSQPKVRTLLFRKVEYNSKDIMFNDYLIVAKYMDEILDEGFERLSDWYVVETSQYINWHDSWLKTSYNNTNIFSDKLFQQVSFEVKKICFELKLFDFKNIKQEEIIKIKKLIFELVNICDGFYITPVLLSNKQEQSIVKLFDYISNFKYNKDFKFEFVDVNDKKSHKVQLLTSIKVTYKNVVYKINLERRKYLLFLSLSPSLCGVYRISYYGINDFKHLLLEILTDYKIRVHHIENNYCFL